MDTQTTANARDAYLSLFPSKTEAVEYEAQVLSSATEFLPAVARSVRDDPDAASPEYYTWLAAQVGLAAEVEIEDPSEPA